MSNFELVAEARNDMGKGASRRLRRLADKIPAVIYGAGQPAESIQIEHRLAIKALENEAFYSHILTLKIDKKVEKVVLKDVQRHVTKPKILHLDFLRISAKEKLTMHVPLHFINENKAPGVIQGGVISHLATDIEIRCLPADLPEYIEVDLGGLALDHAVHLSDIQLPKGVESVALSHGNEHDLSVASIHIPRSVIESDELETEATDDDANDEAAEDDKA